MHRSSFAALLPTLLLLLACGACAAPPRVDLVSWRAREAVERPAAERGALDEELARVERLRAEDALAPARELALALVAEQPDDARALEAASRAESDGVLLFADEGEEARDHAAASALDYAERASERGADSAAAQAQLAWALGTTTHLQAMGERAGHARRTASAAEAALALDPEEPTALSALAILNLRLETLPWIARLMASGLPESSLEEAERYARRAVAARPGREQRLILAKVLVAAGREEEARAALEAALAAGERLPRDAASEAAVRALLEEL